ncbi:uncharacterized protein LOC121932501 isoform X2 [Sceloporus undulatus]|nr:uncharacterized protein LOC121932501 isoform X2 [Sceloporus undulatus]
MAPPKEVPNVHIFSTRAGDVIVRSDLNCYLLLPPLPTSPSAHLHPLHPSLRGGEHYFGSRWHDSIYIIKDNKVLEAQHLHMAPSKEARRLHPSCCGGQHYFAIAGGSFGIILSPGSMTAVKDLSTGEPDPAMEPGQHRWSKEKMESHRSYLYWQLQDNFSGELFSFHPSILGFLPGGLGLIKGSAFKIWELVDTVHNHSDAHVTKTQGIPLMVGCAKERLEDIGDKWIASISDFPDPASIATALAKAQFALPTNYGGLGLNVEEEEWEGAHEEEMDMQFTIQPNKVAYMWQYQLGLGKEAILFCRKIQVTNSRDPPCEIPLPPSS